MRRFLAPLWEIVEFVFIAFVAVFVIRNFLVQPFLVSGASMVPSYQHGDYLLIDELTYRVREPLRGEVVVFRYPKDETVFFIKRIVGLPGERVVIRGGKVWTGRDQSLVELTEEYLSSAVVTAGALDLVLGPDDYFVLGDNRTNSFDSRTWGPISRKEIMGIARVRLYPFDKITAFSAPTYAPEGGSE